MTDAALHLPAAFLHEAFSDRSGVPLEHFELYYRGKRLEGEAALASWGVEKNSTIEVKMRGRGGAGKTDGKRPQKLEEGPSSSSAEPPSSSKDDVKAKLRGRGGMGDQEGKQSQLHEEGPPSLSKDHVRKKLLDAQDAGPAAEQVEALMLLRGASEVLRERWPEDKPLNEWKGVTFKEGQVSELSFEDCANLESLPAEVGGLLALTSLNLSGTALTTLPAEVGGLRALTSLDLSGTRLTMLPAEVGGLRALTSLNLSGTALTTLPAEVGGLRALSSFDLSHTALTTLPAEVGGLRALRSLNLSGTRLTMLPAEVGGLLALISLNLSCSEALTTLPAEVGGLRALTSLNIDQCGALTSPPKELRLDVAAAKDWLHGQHLVAQYSAKQWDGDEMLRCLRDRPGVLHALAEQPAAVDLLRAVLEADPTLADVTEGEKLGRTPIQHACPECRRAMRAALCLLGRFEIDDGPPLAVSATSAVVQADDLRGADEASGDDAKPLRCALKAMRKAEQVLAELNGRDGLDPKY
eukprot:scaffold27240_cov64-Phaeocystis_antarctica.AAC.4